MYFKTQKDSETGRKFDGLYVQKHEIDHANLCFLDKVGATTFIYYERYAAGGIIGVDKVANMTGWKFSKNKHLKGFLVPDKATKEGKKLDEEISNLPTLKRDKFNLAVGFSSIFSYIGCFFDASSGFYFFSVSPSSWDNEYTPPVDCIEIVESEYQIAEKRNK